MTEPSKSVKLPELDVRSEDWAKAKTELVGIGEECAKAERFSRERQLLASEALRALLLEALKKIVKDHDERVAIYGSRELQPNRSAVMEHARAAIKAAQEGK